jgi:hypothetical protein
VHHFDIACGELARMRTTPGWVHQYELDQRKHEAHKQGLRGVNTSYATIAASYMVAQMNRSTSGLPAVSCDDFGPAWANSHALWYASQFPPSMPGSSCKLFAESSPEYLLDVHAAARIAATMMPPRVPELKLIAVLREPVARDFSLARMMHAHFWRNQDNSFWPAPMWIVLGAQADPKLQYALWTSWRLEEEERRPFTTSLSYGRYARQIRSYLAKFRASQLFVLQFKDLLGHSFLPTMAALARFLGIDPALWEATGTLRHVNVGAPLAEATHSSARRAIGTAGNTSAKSFPNPIVCTNLTRFYGPLNRELYALLDGLWVLRLAPPSQPRFGVFELPPCDDTRAT